MMTRSKLFKKDAARKSMQRYTKEVCGVIVAATAVYLLISLLSYRSTDHSLFYFSTQSSAVANWGGAVGAWCAALAFYLFGIAAYSVWTLFVLCCVLLLNGQSLRPALGRLAGLMLASCALSGLCAVLNFDPLYQTSGGLLGYGIGLVVNPLFGVQGSLVVLGSFVWIGLLYATKISLYDGVKKVVLFGYAMSCKLGSKFYLITLRFFKAVKNLLGKKKSSPSPIQEVFAPAHALHSSTDSEKDQQVLEGFDQESFNNEKISFDGESITTSTPLPDVQVRTQSIQVSVGKYRLIRLANSVLSVNAFSLRLSNGALWSEVLHQAIQKADDQFSLPNVHQFTRKPVARDVHAEQEIYTQRGKVLEEKLARFGLNGQVTAIHPGPVITLFEYKPDIDSKISKIIALEDDLAMVLTAHSIRIIAPIPGKDVVGFEIANQMRHEILIAQVLCTRTFEDYDAQLPLVLGVDVIGNPVMCDLVSMPHLLVAGATGSGKSVGMNAMLTSLLCKRSPEEMKLILIDPKRLEFTPYSDIPHLLFPIVTQPHKAAGVLKWLVQEMEQRYELMAAAGVRNVLEYQKLVAREKNSAPMPFIVVMIDELADLMMVAARDVETQIIRLAQMARAAGIHLIVATQRPSVDVVTGLIKVNFPSRISFRVSSKVDSRTILDASGGEKLLGRGDLLFMHASSPNLRRIHGAYISDQEIEKLAQHLRDQAAPDYLDLNDELRRCASNPADQHEDELYETVLEFIKKVDEISISMLQRQYRIGFNRSARIIEKLELDGLIAPAQGSKPRKVLH